MLSFNRIFSDGCVLQRDTENVVRGASAAGSTVTLAVLKDGGEVFSGSSAADDNGRWQIALPPFPGSAEAYSMRIASGSESARISDIYFGELFHISGQSNMELPMYRTFDPLKDELYPKENPLIREFRTPIRCRFSKTARSEDFVGGEWKKAVGADIYSMSAAGYYFAAEVFARLGIPVGLLNTSAGGAALEGFMPYDMVRGYGLHDEFIEKATEDGFMERTAASDAQLEREWYESLGGSDFGLAPSDDMKSCVLPCCTDELHDEEMKDFSGRMYFFREITLSEEFAESSRKNGAKLIFGTVTDGDAIYVNGEYIGETGYLYPPRCYDIREGLLRAGKNVIAVRLDVRNGRGGFTKGKRYCIKSGALEAELTGEWKYAVSVKTMPAHNSVFFQGEPLALYPDMMYPAFKVKCRALVWYQGETDCGRASVYARMFGDFVAHYRRMCGYDIPVIYAQLCDFDGMCGCRENDFSWAELRKAQLDCLAVKNTAMAVTLGLGEYNDLHPKNKREVGKRLARCAFGLLYGDDIPFIRCISAKRTDYGAKLRFSGNVFLKNNAFSMFEAVSADGVHKCGLDRAEQCSDTVRLRFEANEDISMIRYAWRNAPRVLNLYDMSLLPVSPFEVDVEN